MLSNAADNLPLPQHPLAENSFQYRPKVSDTSLRGRETFPPIPFPTGQPGNIRQILAGGKGNLKSPFRPVYSLAAIAISTPFHICKITLWFAGTKKAATGAPPAMREVKREVATARLYFLRARRTSSCAAKNRRVVRTFVRVSRELRGRQMSTSAPPLIIPDPQNQYLIDGKYGSAPLCMSGLLDNKANMPSGSITSLRWMGLCFTPMKSGKMSGPPERKTWGPLFLRKRTQFWFFAQP
jgi:hypothetical protein